MSLVGKRNAYTCKTCGQTIITVDVDEGTTPFMLACRATIGCDGMSESHLYTGFVVNGSEPAMFDWRKPTKKEYSKSSPAMQQHFDMGGLQIYPRFEKRCK